MHLNELETPDFVQKTPGLQRSDIIIKCNLIIIVTGLKHRAYLCVLFYNNMLLNALLNAMLNAMLNALFMGCSTVLSTLLFWSSAGLFIVHSQFYNG